MPGIIKNPRTGAPRSRPILVVEDDEGLNNLAQIALSVAGYDTAGASNGNEAIEHVIANPEIVLLLDIKLPDMTGREIIDTLTERNYQVPFIVMTGQGDEQIAVEMMKLGARDYLVKGLGLVGRLPGVFRRLFYDLETEERLHAAEEALRESEHTLKFVSDTIGDSLFQVSVEQDNRFVFRFVNRAFFETTGMDENDVIGKSLDDIVPGEFLEFVSRHYIKAVKSGQPVTWQETRTFPAGTTTGEITINPAFDSAGICTHLVGSVRDISKRKRAEEALRESEERYRAIFEQAAESIVLIDAETGGLAEFNDSAHENLGYTRKEFKKLKISDFDVIESVEDVAKHIKKVTKEGFDTFETNHRTKDGEILNIQISTRAISLRGKNFIQSIWLDITERKQAEEALRESERFLQESQRIAGIGSYVMETASGIWSSSKVLDEIFGIGPEYLRTFEGWEDLVHPDWRQTMVEYFEHDVLEQRGQFDKEYQIVRRNDGLECWVHGLGELSFDNDGDPVRMIGTIQDITERKRAEEALRESEGMLRRVVTDAPLPIMIHAENGEVLDISQAWTRLSGYSHSDIPTIAEWTEKAYGLRMEDVQAIINDVFSKDVATGDGEFTITTKSGQERIWDFISGPLGRLPDNRRLVLSMATDITERKKAEAELAKSSKLAAIGELAAGVAHEINNPLTNIYNYTQLLGKRFKEDEYVQERIQKITNNILRARDITRGLLTLTGKPVGNRQLVDINGLLSEILGEVQATLSGRDDLVIESDFQEDLPARLFDRGQFQQVVNNLVKNAIDAMPEGGTMTLKSGYDIDSKSVQITIGDTGVGIPEGDLQSIFDPFFTTKATGTGTGLGLSVSASLIRQHGGDLAVESEEGVGTTFIISLPAEGAGKS